ncbi:hypothetical protein ACIBEJ_09680 [Nonomuraea sp. NPDC050790]|uniref:hypothetical protein n=1 Tax=Nonomuraea sp. NPDC050790 TaxID=3364371 RepID=UPI00379258FD
MNTRTIITAALAAGALGALALFPASAAAAKDRCAFAPNRVEYSDNSKIAKRQHRTYCKNDLIGRDGSLTAKGRAWQNLRNGETAPAGSEEQAGTQLYRYHKLGLWNPDKVEYAGGAARALKQFKNWHSREYLDVKGGWNKRGKARFPR